MVAIALSLIRGQRSLRLPSATEEGRVGIDSTAIENQAARIALMVLRASTLSGVRRAVDDYVFMQSGKHMSLSSAVLALAALQKPVECRGHLEGSTLVFSCRVLVQGASLARLHRLATERSQFLHNLVVARCGANVGNAVLLRTVGETLIVPLEAIARWYNDYDMSYSWGDDPGAVRAPGICVVLDIAAPPRIHLRTEAVPEQKPTE